MEQCARVNSFNPLKPYKSSRQKLIAIIIAEENPLGNKLRTDIALVMPIA
jgi:hypothetical protein